MANVALRNWRFLHKMGMAGCRWFEGLGNYLSVRRMATIVGDGRGIDPDAPTVLTIKVLYSQPGLPIAEQGKQGRAQLFGTSFAQYERAFRAQLGDMFAAGGFDPRRDIAGIILNRWGHAYVSPQPGFFFGVDGKPAPRDVLRDRAFGRIAFANREFFERQVSRRKQVELASFHWKLCGARGRASPMAILGRVLTHGRLLAGDLLRLHQLFERPVAA